MRLLARKVMPARIDSLYELMDTAVDCAQKQGFNQERVGEIRLSLEEVLVNIFKYAYPEDQPSGEVEVTCSMSDSNDFIIEVTDSGVPFDMLSAQDPDLGGDIQSKKVGGLGIYFVRQFMNEVQYKRDKDQNKLMLIVRRENQPQSS